MQQVPGNKAKDTETHDSGVCVGDSTARKGALAHGDKQGGQLYRLTRSLRDLPGIRLAPAITYIVCTVSGRVFLKGIFHYQCPALSRRPDRTLLYRHLSTLMLFFVFAHFTAVARVSSWQALARMDKWYVGMGLVARDTYYIVTTAGWG